MKLLGNFLLLISGFMMAQIGFPFWTWQFWAVIAPATIGTILVKND